MCETENVAYALCDVTMHGHFSGGHGPMLTMSLQYFSSFFSALNVWRLCGYVMISLIAWIEFETSISCRNILHPVEMVVTIFLNTFNKLIGCHSLYLAWACLSGTVLWHRYLACSPFPLRVPLFRHCIFAGEWERERERAQHNLFKLHQHNWWHFILVP